MIGYLSGRLQRLDATRAVIVVNGVGYDVHISLSTYYELEGRSEVELDVYTHVREDALSLYGFASPEEKVAFEKLISISGIGPTLAQKILSGISAPDLADAVARSDARKLSTIPGVGKKTAERICLELRDKLALTEAQLAAGPAEGGRMSMDEDVQSALVNLGYRPKDADAALDAARKEIGADAELSALLKAALRQLTK
ncbi:MAG TPA: Holliday junction branch migration protein RuvA [Thermoanaerobaculia bacterium]|nr:Holliday junction branch migration protein RuvA [Thermoanaerobaculia bacterium]